MYEIMGTNLKKEYQKEVNKEIRRRVRKDLA